MKKSTHIEEYKGVLDQLVEMRKEAGFTQRQLAEKPEREPFFESTEFSFFSYSHLLTIGWPQIPWSGVFEFLPVDAD